MIPGQVRSTFSAVRSASGESRMFQSRMANTGSLARSRRIACCGERVASVSRPHASVTVTISSSSVGLSSSTRTSARCVTPGS